MNCQAIASRLLLTIPAATALATFVLATIPTPVSADYVTTVVMSGLDNPRGLAFGPDGSLYVAEAGRGGNGPSIVLGDGVTNTFGSTGALTRLRNGVQERIVTGLPSTARAGGSATGFHDIAFDTAGQLFGVIGFGADPALRSTLGPEGAIQGQLVRLPLNGGLVESVADLAAHEGSANPDGRELNSNPYGLVTKSDGGFIVADAGANAILDVTADGSVSTLHVLPSRPNPLFPIGPPFFSSVPTALAFGSDGSLFMSELTGFPYPAGAANVYRLDLITGEVTVALSGFTNIIDLTFGPAGELYVLQISSNGLASPLGPGPGELLRIDLDSGSRISIPVAGLSFPTAVAVGPDGSLYVSNRGTSPADGQVLRISAVPEPSTLTLAGIGMVGLLGRGWRRRKSVRV